MAKKLSVEEARRVAGNPDGVFVEELRELYEFIGHGSRVGVAGRELWPDSDDPKGHATMIRNYVSHKIGAMDKRLEGRIAEAMEIEGTCELIYDRLPVELVW